MLLNFRPISSATAAARNPDVRRNCTISKLGRPKERPVHKIPLYIVLPTIAMLCTPCKGQNICPWLNVATASGVLGGAATITIDKPDEHTETCLFQAPTAASADLLRISVTISADPQNAAQELVSHEKSCSTPAVPLRAIGNEAVQCSTNTARFRGARVVGRVRNSIFTIEIRSHSRRSEATPNPLDEKIEEIADQVAGALF